MKLLRFSPLLFLMAFLSSGDTAPDYPVTWDFHELEVSHIPPPDPGVKVEFAPSEFYNSLPEYKIYKTFPYYAVGYEPEGYLDSLSQLEPEVVFDPAKLKTEQDWIDAGELVYNWPTNFFGPASFIDAAYLAATKEKITKDGVYPYYSIVLREEGKLEGAALSCATCHNRVMDDGSIVVGGQGNHAFDPNFAWIIENFDIPFEVITTKLLYHITWSEGVEMPEKLPTKKALLDFLKAAPPGSMTRQGITLKEPVTVPSLIGIKDRKYLDKTGLMIHDDPGDIMRYAALNQGMDMVTSYDGYIPMGTDDNTRLPEAETWNHPFGYAFARYSDAQLYALALYLYSLEEPENPVTYPQDMLDKGEVVFKREGCVTCHTPPLFTNNMLTPVNGFKPPADHYEKYDIFDISVETDSVLALYSRRGTGYYKIPSLRGLWHRGPFLHNGTLAELEDLFDPARFEDDYVPTGFKPPQLDTLPVKGHPFGMELTAEEKEALLAYLRSI